MPLTQRPDRFSIDMGNPLSKGLVFAGLGQMPGTTYYRDESGYQNNGTLTGYSGAGDTPADKWQYIPQLGRWGLGFDGSNDYVIMPKIAGTAFTVFAWVYTATTGRGIFGMDFNDYWENDSFDTLWHTRIIVTGTRDQMTISIPLSTWTPVAWIWNSSIDTKSVIVQNSITNKTPTSHGAGSIGVDARVYSLGREMGTAKYLNGGIVDFCFWSRALSLPELQPLFDPSNVMLSGMIREPRPRRSWVGATGSVPLGPRLSILKILRLWPPFRLITAFSKAVDDNPVMSDSMTRLAGLLRAPADSITVGDAVSRALSSTRALNDTLIVIDNISRQLAATRTQDDNIVVNDNATRQADRGRTQDDNTVVNDNATRQVGRGRTQDDGIVIGDSTGRGSGFGRVNDDAITMLDAAIRAAGFARERTDTAGVSDDASRNLAASRSMDDIVGILDAIARIAAYARGQDDTLPASDSQIVDFHHAGAYIRTVADTIGLADDIARVQAWHRTQQDTANLADSIARVQTWQRTQQEVVGLSDSITRVMTFARAMSDLMDLDDVVTKRSGHAGAGIAAILLLLMNRDK